MPCCRRKEQTLLWELKQIKQPLSKCAGAVQDPCMYVVPNFNIGSGPEKAPRPRVDRTLPLGWPQVCTYFSNPEIHTIYQQIFHRVVTIVLICRHVRQASNLRPSRDVQMSPYQSAACHALDGPGSQQSSSSHCCKGIGETHKSDRHGTAFVSCQRSASSLARVRDREREREKDGIRSGVESMCPGRGSVLVVVDQSQRPCPDVLRQDGFC